jgi:hypothetical protein
MIAVKWEFEGDEADVSMVQAAVEKILNRYQRALGGISCPVHGTGLSLVVRGRTLEDFELSIETCCQDFVTEANARIHDKRRRARVSGQPPQWSRNNQPERRRFSRNPRRVSGSF